MKSVCFFIRRAYAPPLPAGVEKDRFREATRGACRSMRNTGLRNPATNALICFAMFYVALNVSDLDRSVAFYRDMAGLELVEQNATGEAFLTSTSALGRPVADVVEGDLRGAEVFEQRRP